MKLAQRLFYYLGGFAIGLILLFFFLGGKKTSCDYSPTARVLKNIRIKERVFSEQALTNMQQYQIDTADISHMLLKGSVDFSKSNTKLDSCKIYFIEGEIKKQNIGLIIKNCDSIAKVNTLEIIK
ncbi:DUF4258 domain-containing protein [Aquimarina sp. MMG016]|uniref:DUF4258 domain-containing protein n=1 Tax=Aquimarina sp. MMG016 TaxID=2822690 RepID=UPI001B39DEA8|nr:DUF4258 domain-containing protein [Aquimarina sp. MMG016]MBQ4819183.1 DUF4258 domain-containing protein [Aquimarina sp. MMG016]